MTHDRDLILSDWHGDAYDRISEPHVAMGRSVIDRLALGGDERVLDAGCGSGRLTELLLELLPRGSAVALDGSASMLEEAARRLARFGDRVAYVRADLASPPLPIEGTVDAAMSTAALHWVLDHDAAFRGFAGTIRSGGRLSFQCGGRGNAAELIEAVRAEGTVTAHVFNFAGSEETRDRLGAAGLVDIETWLEPYTISFATREEMLEYVVVPYLRPATGRPDAELFPLAEAAIERLGRLAIDYVRLNATARRP